MMNMIKSLAVLGVIAGGAFATQPAKADHVSIGFGVTVVPARIYAPPVYVAPPVTVYAAPSYSYSTTYYAPTYVRPPVVVAAPPVFLPPARVVVSAPVFCPPPLYIDPPSLYLPLPIPSLRIGFGFGGGHHGHR
jgi:hypothetical protein